MCGNRINFYCLYIGVFIKICVGCFLFFLFELENNLFKAS